MNKTTLLSALLATLTLPSCVAAADRAADRGEELLAQFRTEMGKLKTETLEEVDQKLQVIVPRAIKEVEQTLNTTIENFLNSDVVAFAIVSATGLISIVVVIVLWLFLGTARAWWKRLGNRSKPQATNT